MKFYCQKCGEELDHDEELCDTCLIEEADEERLDERLKLSGDEPEYAEDDNLRPLEVVEDPKDRFDEAIDDIDSLDEIMEFNSRVDDGLDDSFARDALWYDIPRMTPSESLSV